MSYDHLLKCREATSKAKTDLVNAEVDFLTSQGWTTHWDHEKDVIRWIDPVNKTQTVREYALTTAICDYKRDHGKTNPQTG